MTDQSEAQAHKALKMSPPEASKHTSTQANTSVHPTNPPQASPPSSQTIKPAENADDDEELFAQMRQVREAMSESISWFRAEREKSELSRSSSRSKDVAPPNETEKQRRLREFKVTPSRTEVRLRETGGGGLLPQGWGAVDQGKAREEDGEERLQGFAGSWARDDENGGYGGEGTGASVEDAIEL